MISTLCDFEEFIEKIKDKDHVEIVSLGEQEANEINYLLSRSPIKNLRGTYGQYLNALKEFLFFMKHGTKPDGVSEHNFLLYKSVCENLVKKGQFLPGVLDFFKNPTIKRG
jgi:hypothetical protein